MVNMENSMEFPQKIKNGNTLWPSNSTAEYLSEEIQKSNSKECMHPMFIAVLFTVGNVRKKSKWPSIGEWMKNQ